MLKKNGFDLQPSIRVILAILIIVLLTLACRLLTPAPTPQPPSPTLLAPTSRPPSGISPAPPTETIYIGSPGPNSKIISPILVEGISAPTFEQNLVITLTDINGTQLVLQPTIIQGDVGQSGPFNLSLSFTSAGETPGRISVYDVSPRDGGLVHLASVHVTLLPSGQASINAAPLPLEVIDILQPTFLAEVSGGLLTVSGNSDYFFEANLGLALCGLGGSGAPQLICGTADNLLAEGFATITSADIGLRGPFNGEIAYAVSAPMRGRLVVYAISPTDGAIIHLSSMEVMLNP